MSKTLTTSIDMDNETSHDFVHSVLNSLSAHICVLDERGIIIMVNDAWRRFAHTNSDGDCQCHEGISYLEICDMTTGDDKASAQAINQAIRFVLKGELEEFSLEYPCHSPDEQRWFIGRVTRMQGSSEGRVVVAHENITKRKILEQQQIEMQARIAQQVKAESLSRMAGAIAQKFNSMLAAILGNLERSLDHIPQGGEAAVKIRQALQATWRAAEMNRMMQMYLGQTSDVNESVNLAVTCHDQLQTLLQQKPADVTIIDKLPPTGPIVQGNQQLIQQILTSLVINAWESLGGMKLKTVTVTLTMIEGKTINCTHQFPVDWHPQDRTYACLEVTDTGCGIQMSTLDKLFDPFYSSKMPGRGMGLSVVLGILRNHRGMVTVSSKPNLGSTFKIYLPAS